MFVARSVLVVSFVVYVTLAAGSLLSGSVRNLESVGHRTGREDPPTGATPNASLAGR